ncbi:MAG: hypothetical protein JWO92_1204 [Chitinophagaceae bacterium]|nr:hypothetical protein [Chitinophagaceae bacterium]
MVKFTSTLPGNDNPNSKQSLIHLNDNMIELECDLHPYEISIISVGFDAENWPTYKIESVCCDRFRPQLELYLDRHK